MPPLHRKSALVLVLALAAVTVARIVSTYRVFSVTMDEPAHIGGGMEWLANGTYRLDPLQPPLARVMVAMGPYLKGVRFHHEVYSSEEGLAALHEPVSSVLTAARAGVLPAVVAGLLAVFFWGARLWSAGTGVGAALVLATMPAYLGHGGLATTDVPATAAFAWLMFAFVCWLERPGTGAAVLLGLAGGIACVTKYSLVPFFVASAALMTPARVLWSRRDPDVWRSLIRSLPVVAAVAFLVIWAMFRFDVGPVRGVPVPARGFLHGLRTVAERNAGEDPEFLLGRVYQGGSWLYFPVAVLVKTPLATLLLGLMGVWLITRQAFRDRDWRLVAVPAALAGVLAVGMAQTINIGLRHVLPALPAFALCAAFGFSALWRASGRTRSRALLAAGTVLLSMSSVRVHPDYLSYFNELAGSDPGRILVDSDLDWGQDLLRLRSTVTTLGIDTLHLAYYGSDRSQTVAPHTVPWRVADPLPRGWLAISEYLYRTRAWRFDWSTRRLAYSAEGDARFSGREPVTRVGTSIRLYCVEPASSPSGGVGAIQPPCPHASPTALSPPPAGGIP